MYYTIPADVRARQCVPRFCERSVICLLQLPVRNGGTPLNRYRELLRSGRKPSVQGIPAFRQRGLLYRRLLRSGRGAFCTGDYCVQAEGPSVSSPAMTAPIVTRGRNKTLPPGLRTTPMISSGICPAPFPDWNLASRAVME